MINRILGIGFLIFISSYSNLYCQSVGLVLSGGGAKGLAHIGVIKALEEHGIPIDYITGTSMGAIIGALYASGYSTDEMEAIIYTEDFANWSTGRIPEQYFYYYKNRHTSPSMLSFEFNPQDTITVPIIQTSIIQTHSMDLGLLELFSRAIAYAAYDFDNLFVPFRCVASDIHTNRAVIMKDGELASSVRASMAYPFFFNPVEIDGILLFDGGIHNNFPFDVMIEDFNPDVLIGSKTSSAIPAPTKDNIRLQIENMVTAQTDYDIEMVGGILIDTDVKKVGLLDFHFAANTILEGYNAALKNIDLIKDRITRRVSPEELNMRRQEFIDNLPALIFQNIYVKGSSKYQVEYVINTIRQDEQYFSVDRLRSEYFKLVADDKIISIYPRALFNMETGYFDLYLDLKSETRFEAKIGGNISSSPVNLGFAGIEYKFLGRNSYNLEGNVYFGRLYSSVMARAKIEYPGAIPIFGDMALTFNRWDFFTSSNDPFFEDVRPSYIIQYDGNVKINAGVPVGNNRLIQAGYSAGRIIDRYYQTENFLKSDTADRTNININSFNILYENKSFNYSQFATRGRHAFAKIQFVRGIEEFIPGSTSNLPPVSGNGYNFFAASAGYTRYHRISPSLSIGLSGEVVMSLQSFLNNYTSTLLISPAFNPIPHSNTLFLKNYRSPSYGAAGLIPLVKLRDPIHLRLEAYIFQPYRKIGRDDNMRAYYHDRLKHRHFMGGAAVVYNTPVGPASLSIYYYEKSGQKFYFQFNFGYLMFNQRAL